MKIALRALLCPILTTVIYFNSFAQIDNTRLDSLVAITLVNKVPGGVVQLSKGDEVYYNKAFGVADIELNVAMQPNHVFRLGSVTKQFTAAAILKLMEEGRLSLTDDIRKYLPDFPDKNQPITIEALLTHTAGVVNYTGLPTFTDELKRKDLSPEQLINLFKNEPLEFKPGTAYKYSNSGYVLLGYIIEKITQKTYEAYIDELIFKPLKMNDSYYDSANRLIPGRVSGYTQHNGRFKNADFLSMTLPYAAGSLASTAKDLQIWNNALAQGEVLKTATLKKAFSPYQLTNGQLIAYGYGWEIGNVQGISTVKHVGVVNGFLSYVILLPAENITLSILLNSNSAVDIDYFASTIIALALNRPFEQHPVNLKPAELKSLQGVYKLPSGQEYRIRLEDKDLMYYYLGGPKSRLIPNHDGNFLQEHSLTSFNFEKDKKGKVISFTALGTGLPIKAERINNEVKTLEKIHIAVSKLQSYTGSYQFDKGPLFQVLLVDGKLYGQVGTDKKELIPFATTQFYARELDANIIFEIDSTGNVTGLTKIQNSEMHANKIMLPLK